MLQIYKCLSKENPSFMWKFVEKRDIKYELRTKNLLQAPNVKKAQLELILSYPEVLTFGTHYLMI